MTIFASPLLTPAGRSVTLGLLMAFIIIEQCFVSFLVCLGGSREGRRACERRRDGGGHAGGPHRWRGQQLQVPDPLHGRPPPRPAGGGAGGPHLRGKIR